MSKATLFIDESGIFEPRGVYWPLGMRLVGGVVLPGDAPGAETRATEILRGALDDIGLGWWHGEVSGKFFGHAQTLAQRVLAAPGAPRYERELAEGVRRGILAQEAALGEAGCIWRRKLRRKVSERLEQNDARFLLVSEHGSPGVGALPGSAPYRRMLASLLGHSALWASTRWKLNELCWVVADRPGLELHNLPLQPWSRALDTGVKARPAKLSDVKVGEPIVEKAAQRSGLQLADLFVHALGPGKDHDRPITRQAAQRRSKARVEAELRTSFGSVNPWLAEHDALRMAEDVRGLLGARAGAEFDEARRAVAGHDPQWPPDGVFPAAVSWAQADAASALGVK